MQSQTTSQKRAVKKVRFIELQNIFFFILTPLTFKPHNFLFFIHFNNLKWYKSTTWSSTNHVWTLKATEQYTLNFFRCLGTDLCSVLWFVFWVFDTLYFGGHNFLISNSFSMIVNVSDVLRGEVQMLFEHQKQQSTPFGSGLPRVLKCSVTSCHTMWKMQWYVNLPYLKRCSWIWKKVM